MIGAPMTLDEFTFEMEQDLAWRDNEISLLLKSLPQNDLEVQAILRKPAVVMLYSHLEGFGRFCLLHYITVLNKQQLKIGDASHSIVAASCSTLFKELRNPEKKENYFRSLLPDDSNLHRLARNRHFIEEYEKRISQTTLQLLDSIVDLESNLKPEVLEKNLYLLGLRYKVPKEFSGNLTTLLNFRNKIAHGDFRNGIDQARYQLCFEAYRRLAKFIKSTLVEAFQKQIFLKSKSLY